MDLRTLDDCAICKMPLNDGGSHATPGGCSCLFHCICLQEWKNMASPTESIACPSCGVPFMDVEAVNANINITGINDTASPSHASRAEDQPTLNQAEDQNVVTDTITSSQPLRDDVALNVRENNENVTDISTEQREDTVLMALENQRMQKEKDCRKKHPDDDEYEMSMPIHIRRAKILHDTYSEVEDIPEDEWRPTMKVTFIGESGVDTGGLSREFFSLFYEAISNSSYMSGSSPHMSFSHDQVALKSGKFENFGKLISLALLNGHQAPQFLSSSVVNHILGWDQQIDPKILIRELAVHLDELKTKLVKINDSQDEATFQSLVAVSELPERFDIGFNKMCLSLSDKLPLINAVSRHYQVSQCLEEIQSLMKGMGLYGVLDILRKDPAQSSQLFQLPKLKVADFESFFLPVFAESGSNEKAKEDEIYLFWVRFLKDCGRERIKASVVTLDSVSEGAMTASKDVTLRLQDIMKFCTGSTHMPSSGAKGQIIFSHERENHGVLRHITANTCAMQVTVPVNDLYSGAYSTFKENLRDDILNSPGFGQV